VKDGDEQSKWHHEIWISALDLLLEGVGNLRRFAQFEPARAAFGRVGRCGGRRGAKASEKHEQLAE